MAQLIDGKAVAAKIRAELKDQVLKLQQELGVTPGIAVIRIGDDPASKVYVGGKKKAAEEIGFRSWEHHLDASVSQAEVMALIQKINDDPQVHGVLLQLPVPKQLDPDALIAAVRPEKDADGFHPVNAGNLLLGRPGTKACTPWGVMRLLKEYGVNPSGKRAVIVGRSNIVGKPMAMMLLAADATVTVCHRKSDIRAEVERADIVVVAAGVAELVKGEWIKPGAAVIDVGMNRNAAGKLVGDVEFAPASERAELITPVPGGVGPMTIAILMQNTYEAAVRAGK